MLTLKPRFRPRTLALLALAAVLAAFALAQHDPVAGMSLALLFFAGTVRSARAQAVITAAGAGAKLKLYNGTKPAAGGAVTGGNTLLASGAFGASIGTASATGIDFDEAGFTQTSSGFVNGTPTFCDITTSGDVVVARVDIGAGAGNWLFSGTVTTGQNITLTTLVITEGNSA